MVESVDTPDLKSVDHMVVPVRVRVRAPIKGIYMNKDIRPMSDEERQRAKEREKANSEEKKPIEEWPDNPVDGHAI